MALKINEPQAISQPAQMQEQGRNSALGLQRPYNGFQGCSALCKKKKRPHGRLFENGFSSQ